MREHIIERPQIKNNDKTLTKRGYANLSKRVKTVNLSFGIDLEKIEKLSQIKDVSNGKDSTE